MTTRQKHVKHGSINKGSHSNLCQRRQSQAYCVGPNRVIVRPQSKLKRAKIPVKVYRPNSDASSSTCLPDLSCYTTESIAHLPAVSKSPTKSPDWPSTSTASRSPRTNNLYENPVPPPPPPPPLPFPAMSLRPKTAKPKQQAYIVELHDDEDMNEALKNTVETRAERHEVEKVIQEQEQVSLPVVIDVKTTTTGGRSDPNPDAGGEPQVCCFTCYIGPCPELINANFKHPEFMICYRDENSQCINGMMRYYCCPLYLATYKKDGEDTFELRAVQTEVNIGESANNAESGSSGYTGGGGGHGAGSAGPHSFHSYYTGAGSGGGHPAHGMPSCHSFSSHQFGSYRHLPPQFNFLHHCSCSCPPQMMTYYLNYRFSNGHATMPPHVAGQPFRQFAYPNYTMYTTQGNSAMG